MLAAQVWANNLYHIKSGRAPEGVDLSTPLSYADRFRIRRPGIRWDVHPPHVDGVFALITRPIAIPLTPWGI